ncbi:MAG: 3,4-dihydroxyphenylacetate 2,3-dioxygenase [Actinomycetaceae bacterium]|nr:3,4-dihydroxyphenylacetate 2,3-dioxygenase [Actinomycetaceae bacterium]
MVAIDPRYKPSTPAPNILRAAYMELIVTDLQRSRHFYVDVLGLIVTEENENEIYLRTYEEYIHHNLVLKKGDAPAVSAYAFRVASQDDVYLAEAYFKELGCEVRRGDFSKGVRNAVRVVDPFGFPYEFFYETDHVERKIRDYDEMNGSSLMRLDHFNQIVGDVEGAAIYMQNLGFKVTENIMDDEGTTYAAWVTRKSTVHDTALTGGDGPLMHHVAFSAGEKNNIIHLCDRLGALRMSDCIERGPGRHGVSNAFYLYLRDPDGHRIEIYTSDYYTGDPDNPTLTWDVHDDQRRSWWGGTSQVVLSWYTENSPVLDLDGNVQPIRPREDKGELDVTVGADGFIYTDKGEHNPR